MPVLVVRIFLVVREQTQVPPHRDQLLLQRTNPVQGSRLVLRQLLLARRLRPLLVEARVIRSVLTSHSRQASFLAIHRARKHLLSRCRRLLPLPTYLAVAVPKRLAISLGPPALPTRTPQPQQRRHLEVSLGTLGQVEALVYLPTTRTLNLPARLHRRIFSDSKLSKVKSLSPQRPQTCLVFPPSRVRRLQLPMYHQHPLCSVHLAVSARPSPTQSHHQAFSLLPRHQHLRHRPHQQLLQQPLQHRVSSLA